MDATKTIEPFILMTQNEVDDAKESTPLMKRKDDLTSKGGLDTDDFLSFIEKQEEAKLNIGKEPKINPKEFSLASTNTGYTNAKMVRPFSGDAVKNQNIKQMYSTNPNKIGAKAKMARPRTAKQTEYQGNTMGYLLGTKNSTGTPNRDESKLSGIQEMSSKHSETEYELSSENSDEMKSKAYDHQHRVYSEATSAIFQRKHDSNENDKCGQEEIKFKPTNRVNIYKSSSENNVLFESVNTQYLGNREFPKLSKQTSERSFRKESEIEWDNGAESVAPASSKLNLGSPVQKRDTKPIMRPHNI